jgi:hypothetical protein
MCSRPTGDDIIDWLLDLYDSIEEDVVPLPTLQNMDNLFTSPTDFDRLSLTDIDLKSVDSEPRKRILSKDIKIEKEIKKRSSLAELLKNDEKDKKDCAVIGPRDSTKETVGEYAKRIEKNLKSQQSNTEQSRIGIKSSISRNSSINSVENSRYGIKISDSPLNSIPLISPPLSPSVKTQKSPLIIPTTYSNSPSSPPRNSQMKTVKPLNIPLNVLMSIPLDISASTNLLNTPVSTNLLNTPVSKYPLSDSLSPLTPVDFQSSKRNEISADRSSKEDNNQVPSIEQVDLLLNHPPSSHPTSIHTNYPINEVLKFEDYCEGIADISNSSDEKNMDLIVDKNLDFSENVETFESPNGGMLFYYVFVDLYLYEYVCMYVCMNV